LFPGKAGAMLWRHEHTGAAARMPARPVGAGPGNEARALEVEGRQRRHPVLRSSDAGRNQGGADRRDHAAVGHAAPAASHRVPRRRCGHPTRPSCSTRRSRSGSRRRTKRSSARMPRSTCGCVPIPTLRPATGCAVARRPARRGSPDFLRVSAGQPARGAHSLMAAILDAQGNAKIRSEPRVFHVQQPTLIERAPSGQT